jgi:acetyl-CoA carboxylase carboxyltransferase component
MTLALVEPRTEKLTPLERLEALCDPGSLQLIRSEVVSSRMPRAMPGDGVVGGAGRVDGRPVFCYAQDPAYAGGSLGAAHADTIVRILRLADRAGAPVVAFVESAGARLQEGLAALGGYGRIFREHVRLSGRVPQISVITGASAGGGSYAPALTDFVVMTEAATMFLTGPAVVREVMGEELSAADLGGPRVHDRNGVSHFTAAGDADAARLVRELLGYLSQDPRPALEPPGGALRVPDSERQVYDVRGVIDELVDAGEQLEVAPRWARNLVTSFARLDGRPVGVIANQPRHLGGVLDADAAQKGARFVRTCDLFGLRSSSWSTRPASCPARARRRRASSATGPSSSTRSPRRPCRS